MIHCRPPNPYGTPGSCPAPAPAVLRPRWPPSPPRSHCPAPTPPPGSPGFALRCSLSRSRGCHMHPIFCRWLQSTPLLPPPPPPWLCPTPLSSLRISPCPSRGDSLPPSSFLSAAPKPPGAPSPTPLYPSTHLLQGKLALKFNAAAGAPPPAPPAPPALSRGQEESQGRRSRSGRGFVPLPLRG
ncbi:uncharacterized protein LOC135578632 [Columba livia]|uniref:uncharacterized protein LOC135578632 n=1 Tax=Columba livia TaxID=8932 RepID=UPI0031BAA00A